MRNNPYAQGDYATEKDVSSAFVDPKTGNAMTSQGIGGDMTSWQKRRRDELISKGYAYITDQNQIDSVKKSISSAGVSKSWEDAFAERAKSFVAPTQQAIDEALARIKAYDEWVEYSKPVGPSFPNGMYVNGVFVPSVPESPVESDRDDDRGGRGGNYTPQPSPSELLAQEEALKAEILKQQALQAEAYNSSENLKVSNAGRNISTDPTLNAINSQVANYTANDIVSKMNNDELTSLSNLQSKYSDKIGDVSLSDQVELSKMSDVRQEAYFSQSPEQREAFTSLDNSDKYNLLDYSPIVQNSFWSSSPTVQEEILTLNDDFKNIVNGLQIDNQKYIFDYVPELSDVSVKDKINSIYAIESKVFDVFREKIDFINAMYIGYLTDNMITDMFSGISADWYKKFVNGTPMHELISSSRSEISKSVDDLYNTSDKLSNAGVKP